MKDGRIAYCQPSFFKFGNDSIELFEFIYNEKSEVSEHFLEVGAGCGVISIELARKDSTIRIDSLEPQEEFYNYFYENIKNHKINNVKLIKSDIENYSKNIIQKYDVIFMNPPYFWSDESRASPQLNRDMCRRMDKEIFILWLRLISHMLSTRGDIFMSYRHTDVEDIIQSNNTLEVVRKAKCRGCYLIHLRRIF